MQTGNRDRLFRANNVIHVMAETLCNQVWFEKLLQLGHEDPQESLTSDKRTCQAIANKVGRYGITIFNNFVLTQANNKTAKTLSSK